MNLIDPHYGKKAAAVLGAGTVLGLAATTVPTVGVALGPTVGGAIIAGGLAYIETDAHRKVGDHALLDSLLDDRGDNVNTNTTLLGYDGVGDRVSSFDLAQIEQWSDDSEDEEFASLLPPSLGGKATGFSDESDGISLTKKTSASEPELTDAFDLLGLRGSESGAKAAPKDPLDFFSLDSAASPAAPSSSVKSASSPYSSTGSAPAVMSSTDFFDLLSVAAPAPAAAKPAVPRPPSPELAGGGARFRNPHTTPTLQVLENPSLKPAIQLEPPAPPKDDFFATLLEPTPLQPTKAHGSLDSSTSSSEGIPEQISMKLQQNARAHASHVGTSPQPPPPQQSVASHTGFDFFAPQPAQTQASFFAQPAAPVAQPVSAPAPAPVSAPAAPEDPFADLFLRASGSSDAASRPLF